MQGQAPMTALAWGTRGRQKNRKYVAIMRVRNLLADFARSKTTPSGDPSRTDAEMLGLYEQALVSWNDESPETTLSFEDMLGLPAHEQGLFAYGAYSYGRGEDEARRGERWWVYMDRVGQYANSRDAACYTQWVRWLNHKHKRG